jgi:hypothetical protein
MTYDYDGLLECYVAIQQSWTATFVGVLPLLGLQDHIAEQLSDPQAYGNYCTIVQSSGMGKSRLLDELSKSFFLIPINLRSADSRGTCYCVHFPSPLHLSDRLSPF